MLGFVKKIKDALQDALSDGKEHNKKPISKRKKKPVTQHTVVQAARKQDSDPPLTHKNTNKLAQASDLKEAEKNIRTTSPAPTGSDSAIKTNMQSAIDHDNEGEATDNAKTDQSTGASFSKKFADRAVQNKISSRQDVKAGKDLILEKKLPTADGVDKKYSDAMTKKGTDSSSKADKLSKDAKRVYLVRGKDRGRPAWHYVLVDKNLLPIFLKHTQGGTVDVAKFGKILHSGWGKDPPEEIKQKIEEEYH